MCVPIVQVPDYMYYWELTDIIPSTFNCQIEIQMLYTTLNCY